MKTTILKVFILSGIALFAFNAEATGCNFTRDLWVGSSGEDVRCLQQYLNTSSSVGYYGSSYYSIGYPDGVFGMMTRQALMTWQASNGLTASGYFDAASRAKYLTITGGVIGGGNYNNYYGGDTTRAMQRITEALKMIRDAQDEIDDSRRNTTSAENSLDDARIDMVDAMIAYFVDGNYTKAYTKANDAFNNAEDAFDDAGGTTSSSSSSRTQANDAIDDAREAIDEAQDDIDYADDRGRDVRDAEDLLNEAEDRLEDAEDAYGDGNYSRAKSYANQAEDMAYDAVDAID
ncbi:MAG: peptidoglycan-binding protein [Candidatus Paceibacterota bacterium]